MLLWLYMFISFHSFSSFRYILRRRIVGSYGNSMFNFWKNHCFLQRLQHFTFSLLVNKFPNFSTSCQPLLFPDFFFWIVAILMNVKWYLIIVWVYIFPITRDVEHIFMCFLDICISSLEKYLYKSFAHFKIRLVLLLFAFELHEFCVYLNSNPLSDIWFANTFFPSVGCLSLLIVSFDDQRVILIVQRYYVNLKICFPKLYHVSPSRTVHLKDTLGKETMEGKGEAIMQTGFFFFLWKN